jgi:hypothetical protein
MRNRLAALALPLAFAFACTENPAAPISSPNAGPRFQVQHPNGSGLTLNSVTGISLPLIGSLGDVTVSQAVVENFAIVEDVVGQIVGVQAEGVLQLTGGVLGSEVISQDFVTTVDVTSGGFGQCGIVTLDLAPIDVNLLVAQVDVPAATVPVRGSGAVGNLLCALGQLLNPVTQGVRGVVQALNRLI